MSCLFGGGGVLVVFAINKLRFSVLRKEEVDG
jgi:hypothetical protein